MTPTTKTVLVTGGAGFIGSHLCERLIAAGRMFSASTTSSPVRRANIARPARATRASS